MILTKIIKDKYYFVKYLESNILALKCNIFINDILILEFDL